MGEVNKPGQVAMGSTRLTLTDVITEVGGIKEVRADAPVFVRLSTVPDDWSDVYQFDLRNSVAYVFANQFRVEHSMTSSTSAPQTSGDSTA